jgi:hypothetical protein
VQLPPIGSYYRNPATPRVVVKVGGSVSEVGADFVLYVTADLEDELSGWSKQHVLPAEMFAERFPDGPHVMIPGLPERQITAATFSDDERTSR